MTDDELHALVAELRALRERWGQAAARAALTDNAALSSAQRTHVESLVFFGSGNQFGAVTMGDVAGRDVVKGPVNQGTIQVFFTTAGLRDPTDTQHELVVSYLERLAEKCDRLRLSGAVSRERRDASPALTLSQIYVGLAAETWERGG